MFGLGILAYYIKLPKLLAPALQHLAAGIVLSAVAVELVPTISNAPNTPDMIGVSALHPLHCYTALHCTAPPLAIPPESRVPCLVYLPYVWAVDPSLLLGLLKLPV